jgi:hypothetical protein
MEILFELTRSYTTKKCVRKERSEREEQKRGAKERSKREEQKRGAKREDHRGVMAHTFLISA